MSDRVGLVIGTEDATPLDFWAGIAEDQYLQLDDIVAVRTPVPGHGEVMIYGIVDDVRSRHDGAKFASDVFLVERQVLPVGVSRAAHISVTRIESDTEKDREVLVPPQPGRPVLRAKGVERERALYFDRMVEQRRTGRFSIGLGRDGEPLFGSADFLNGKLGAHVNISGVSGVAAKTSYALFLLHSLFNSGVLNVNDRALVFNVKGEDLLFVDKPNAGLNDDDRAQYSKLGLPTTPFQAPGLWAPASADSPFEIVHTLNSRQDESVRAYAWSIREFCQDRLLRFLFADADAETSQLAFAVAVVEDYLERQADQLRCKFFEELVEHIIENGDDIFAKSYVATQTREAFFRRLKAADHRLGHLIRGLGKKKEAEHGIDWQGQLNVIDINSLHDQAKRFVVGVILKRITETKEKQGREPLFFLVLDELNKYAPREGWSPIKEIVLDIAERGRSLGIILIGAQQTASEVERRVVANASFRAVGRLDSAEARHGEYGFLTDSARLRASLLKPGSLFLSQPDVPLPLMVQFPRPSWATRSEETAHEGPLRAKWR